MDKEGTGAEHRVDCRAKVAQIVKAMGLWFINWKIKV